MFSKRIWEKEHGDNCVPKFGEKARKNQKPWEAKGKTKVEVEQHLRELFPNRGNINVAPWHKARKK